LPFSVYKSLVLRIQLESLYYGKQVLIATIMQQLECYLVVR
jgi:hypothetical protein